jgi:hypothetical protein
MIGVCNQLWNSGADPLAACKGQNRQELAPWNQKDPKRYTNWSIVRWSYNPWALLMCVPLCRHLARMRAAGLGYDSQPLQLLGSGPAFNLISRGSFWTAAVGRSRPPAGPHNCGKPARHCRLRRCGLPKVEHRSRSRDPTGSGAC